MGFTARCLGNPGRFMLKFEHMRIGCSIELPELATHVSNRSSTFIVKGVFAGGMGVCIQLFHPEANREYALKGIRPDFIGERAAMYRFLDELEVWVAASSCNLIAEALAVVRLNELPYVLATWMPNGDLEHALSRLTASEKMEALLRIAGGLSWVKNNLGVIHRDLKPSNILLDEHGLAYVADWGLARPVGRALDRIGKTVANTVDRPDRTQQGDFLGTITYAAPEQITGTATIDHRADIYALGCMMYEFEAGTPPFLGKTVVDIANQHLWDKPRKLGGWLTPTELGLEHVIARCLEKDPTDRYQSYEQLRADILPIARKQGVALERCEPGLRYKRTVLGKGEKQQVDMLMNVPNNNRGKGGYMVVDLDDLLPFLKEASDLMAVERYAEAERIYQPHVLPEMLGEWVQWWGVPHDMGVNYGLCLNHLGRSLEAEAIFLVLGQNDCKSAVFYVNYSMTLNLLGKSRQAADLCREGLKCFPKDIDIQGNLTIALINVGEYEQAVDSAFKRLETRRDVHSLDEAASALFEYATAIRYTDLPHAIDLAKAMGDLIKEALHLNPNYHIAQLRAISLRSLVQDAETVNTLAPALWESKLIPLDIRKNALIQMLEHWNSSGWGTDVGAESVLQFIKNHPVWLSLIPKLKEMELRTIARYKMIRSEDGVERRVIDPEIEAYFLKKEPSGVFPDPILAAQLKNWVGASKEALAILADYLSGVPSDFNAIKVMATLHASSGNLVEAMRCARALVKFAPWRAEAYDCLAFVAGKAGDTALEQQSKIKGDRVFADEMRLYDEAIEYLNRP